MRPTIVLPLKTGFTPTRFFPSLVPPEPLDNPRLPTVTRYGQQDDGSGWVKKELCIQVRAAHKARDLKMRKSRVGVAGPETRFLT